MRSDIDPDLVEGPEMDSRLPDNEVADIAQQMRSIATALFENKQHLQLETVRVSRRLTSMELANPFAKLPPVIEEEGIRFAKGVESMEALVFQRDGHIMIAVKITRPGLRKGRADYWYFTISGYIRWLADRYFLKDNRKLAAKALQELKDVSTKMLA